MRQLGCILAAVSFLLLAVCIVAWVRSYLPHRQHVVSRDGGVMIIGVSESASTIRMQMGDRDELEIVLELIDPSAYRVNVLGFKYYNYAAYLPRFQVPVISYWFLALVTAAWPIGWYRLQRRRAARGRSNKCLACGYDIRASPARCPECGTPRAGDSSSPHQTSVDDLRI